MYRYFLVAVLCFFAPAAMATSVSLSFSESSAELGISTGGDYSDTVDFGLTGYYNEDKDVLVTLDMLTALEGDNTSPWLFSLGAKAFGLLLQRQLVAGGTEKQDGYIGIAVAFQFGYRFLTALPLALVFDVSYSPDILNNSEVESIRQLSGFVEFMLSPSAIAQIGYRQYRADLQDDIHHLGESYKTFEDNVVAGIKLRF